MNRSNAGIVREEEETLKGKTNINRRKVKLKSSMGCLGTMPPEMYGQDRHQIENKIWVERRVENKSM